MLDIICIDIVIMRNNYAIIIIERNLYTFYLLLKVLLMYFFFITFLSKEICLKNGTNGFNYDLLKNRNKIHA